MRVRALLLFLVGSMIAPTLGLAAPAMAAPSDAQLRSYAYALVEVDQMRQRLSERSKALLPADRIELQSEQRHQVYQILLRNALSRDRFNAISSMVDQRPVLRRKVHQFAMEALVGA